MTRPEEEKGMSAEMATLGDHQAQHATPPQPLPGEIEALNLLRFG